MVLRSCCQAVVALVVASSKEGARSVVAVDGYATMALYVQRLQDIGSKNEMGRKKTDKLEKKMKANEK